MNRLSGSPLVLWGTCALLFAAGCGGCFKSPDERRLLGTFLKPVAGAQLTDADRAEGDTLAGLRVSVEAMVEWESLTSGKREPALPGACNLSIRQLADDGSGGIFVDGPTAQVTDAGTVVFPSVEFPATGTYELELTARAADSDFISDPLVIAVTAVTSNDRPSVQSVALPQDANGDGILNAEEVPLGSPVELVVFANGMDAGTVTLTTADGLVEVSAEYVEDGTWMALDLGPDALERTVEITVLLTNPLGQQNSVGQLPGVPLDVLARQELKLDQVAPTLAFTAPVAGEVLTNNAVTLSVAVTGADDQPVAFTRAPRATPAGETDIGSAVVTSGVANLDVVLPNGQWLLRARVLDTAGNEAIPAELDADVANGRPQVDSVVLAQDLNADGVLNALELAVGTPLQLGITASGMADGGTLKVSSVATGSEAISEVADGGAQVALDLDAGVPLEVGVPLQLLLTTVDGVQNNLGQLADLPLDPLATPTVVVDQVAPGMVMSAPVDGDSLSSNEVTVAVAVTGAEGQPVTFTRVDASDAGTLLGTVAVDGGTASLAAAVSNGTWIFRAEVADVAGNPASAEAAGVVVAGQQLSITSPANGRVFKASDDLDGNTGGLQSQVNFQPAPTGGFTVDLCLSVDPGAVPSAPCPDGSGYFLALAGASSPASGFTFPEGGPYQVRAVRSYGGVVFDASADVTVRVNSSRPAVTGLSLPQDLNADGQLNLAELGTGPIQVKVTALDVEPLQGAAVTLINDATGAACGGGTLDGANEVTLAVSASCATLPGEFSLPLRVRVTDGSGNANRLLVTDPGTEPINAAAFLGITVDTVAPAFAFSSPSVPLLGTAADANLTNGTFDLALEGTAPGAAMVDFQVTGGVTNLAIPGVPSVAGFSAEAALPPSGNVTYTLSATPVDAAGNPGATQTAVVDVDLDVPAVSISAPTTGFISANRNVTVSVSVPGETGTAEVYSVVGGVESLRGTMTVTSGSGSGTVSLSNGTQDVRVKYTDTAGNVGSADVANVTISDASCDLLVNVPSATANAVGSSLDADPATPSTLELAFAGTSSNCSGLTVTVKVRGGATLCTAVVDGSGNWNCTPAPGAGLAEGTAQLDMEVTNTATPPATTTVQRDFAVDLQAPALAAVPFEDGGTLVFVATENVHLLDAGTPDAGGPVYVPDNNVGTPGAQATLSFTVTGAQGGTATVLFKGTAVDTVSINSDPVTLTRPVTLPHDDSGALTLEVQDAAGNLVVQTATATIDVEAPSAPSFTSAPAVTNLRTASASMAWGGASDDATSGAGTVAGYDLRWSTDILFPSGVALTSSSVFFDPKKARRAAAGEVNETTATVTIPPMNSSVGFAVRAYDEVGNYSPLPGSTPTVSTVWSKVEFANPTVATAVAPAVGNTLFGAAVSRPADLNGDGLLDFVTSSPGGTPAPGTVHVFYGNANLASMDVHTFSFGASGAFGSDVGVGNVGDAAGENRPDLLVGAQTFTTSTGRAYLFLGPATPQARIDTTAPYVFDGPGTNSIFGVVTRVIPDLDGDGLSEVLISASNFSSNNKQGRVFIYYGRSKAQWDALTSNATVNIPVTQANCIIDGPTPIASGTAGNAFARTAGTLGISDINGDGLPELLIPSSNDQANRAYVISGATVKASCSANPGATPPTPLVASAGNVLQELKRPGFGTGTGFSGLGNKTFGGFDFVGDSAVDLVLSEPGNFRVHVVSATGTASQPFPLVPVNTPPVTFDEGFLQTAYTIAYSPPSGVTAQFGTGVSVDDLTGDGLQDLVVGQSGNGGGLWIFPQTGVSGSAFDTTAGGGFFQSLVRSTTNLGVGVVVGDFNGDGKPDIVGTDSGTTAAGGNKLTLWSTP